MKEITSEIQIFDLKTQISKNGSILARSTVAQGQN